MNPLSDYAIQLRTGRSYPTGDYVITRYGNRRPVTKFRDFYQTKLGELTPEKWRELTLNAIKEHGKEELLERIKEHCRDNCAWLKKERDIEEHAMECLVSGAYLYWDDFCDETGYMYFYFPEEDDEYNGGNND
jgi:hypothetical protein